MYLCSFISHQLSGNWSNPESCCDTAGQTFQCIFGNLHTNKCPPPFAKAQFSFPSGATLIFSYIEWPLSERTTNINKFLLKLHNMHMRTLVHAAVLSEENFMLQIRKEIEKCIKILMMILQITGSSKRCLILINTLINNSCHETTSEQTVP